MKKKWVLGGLLLLALAAAGLGWWGGIVPVPGAVARSAAKAGEKKAEPPLAFAPAEVVAPAWARLPEQVAFSGPLVAPQTAVVRARVAGTLVVLAVAEGQRVKAGQVIGRVEMTDTHSRLAERDANLLATQALLAQAERTHASNERLAAQQFISPIALDHSRAALDAARAGMHAAAATLETLRASLRDATLVAPISGIVARRQALPGEKVSAEQPLLTLVDLARLELAGNVGTHEVSRLAPGLPVQVQVEGVATPVAGHIARIAPAAEPGTRSIGVTIELANPQEKLRAGQYALALVTLQDDRDRLTLPANAIGSSAGQHHVWLIEQGVLARRAVTLGRQDERAGRVEVLQGVAPDSQVLAARFDNLREGAQARIVAQRAAEVASAAAAGPSSPK